MKGWILCVDEDHLDIITDLDGVRVASTYAEDRQTRRLLAERFVLCWNACRGLTNSEIANGLTPNASARTTTEIRNDV